MDYYARTLRLMSRTTTQFPAIKKWVQSHRLITAAIILTWTAAACGVGFLAFAIHNANTLEARQEAGLIRNGLKLSQQDMKTKLKSITIWDEAVEKINNRPDAEFIDDNVGTWFADYVGFPTSIVLDGQDQVTYYYADGSQQAVSKAGPWLSAIRPMVAKLRQAEKADNYALLKDGSVYRPRMSVDFVMAGGTAALVGISSMVPDFEKVMPKAGPSALVVAVLPVAEGLVANIARNTLVEKARFSMTAPTDGTKYVDIRSADGSRVGVIDWKPNTPGQAILAAVWAPSLAVIAILLAASFIIYRESGKTSDELFAAEARATHMSQHDGLTGLNNRYWFTECLKAELKRPDRHETSALLFLDLDRFTEINDSMGLSAGDEMLVQVASRLKRLISERGFVARLSGDEFAIFLSDASQQKIYAFTRAIKESLNTPFELVGTSTRASATVGFALIERGMTDDAELTRWAELALNKARALGRGSVVQYTDELDKTIQMRRQLANDIRTSLDAMDFYLLYQPLVDVRTMQVRGVEALLRWNHRSQGPISPAIFIPIAERAGLIRDISNWVMRKAFRDSLKWPNVMLSINISPLHMKHPEFISDVKAALVATRADARQIGLEVTEGVLLEHSATLTAQLAELRRLGFKIVLDDFGTGYSSLDYLHRYKFDRVKIDKSFVQGLDSVMQAPAIVQSVIALSHMSGADVVAEGVETTEQYEFIKEAGADLIQGFYFFEALSADDVLELVPGKQAEQNEQVA